MAEFIKSYQAHVGLNHTPAYQVSGRPFATGSVDVTTAKKIDFPYLTRWFQVVNKSASPVNVGFSQFGVTNDPAGGTNFLQVDASGSSGYGKSEVYEIDQLDRVGAGDSFTGAVLYGFLKGWSDDKIISFAAASFAISHTKFGDVNCFNDNEIESFKKNNSIKDA